MKFLTVFSVVLCIFCVLPPKVFCGLFGKLIDFVIDTPETTSAPTTINPLFQTTVKTKFVSVEEIVFLTAPHLQECYNPSDDEARLNYVISPLSVSNLLGQLLIGTYGPIHNRIAKFLNLNPPKSKRDVQLIQITDDKLYDEKVDHTGFHWKLRMSTNQIKANENVNIENALMYNRHYNVVEYFENKIQKFYQTELFKVDFQDLNSVNDTNKWTQFSENNIAADGINITAKSLFFNRFELNATWQSRFYKKWKEEPFTIKPFTNVSVRYIKGRVKNTTYISNAKFTLVAVPLQNIPAKMYILHPRKQNYRIRSFSESLADFNIVSNLEDPSNYRDVDLKIPDIFNYEGQVDIMKPIANEIESTLGKRVVKAIKLNRAAKKLAVTNLVSQLRFSISNEENFTEQESASSEKSLPLVKFQIDSPFVFFIMHSPSRTVLIWGSISDPRKLVL